jgi:hypothetical protein
MSDTNDQKLSKEKQVTSIERINQTSVCNNDIHFAQQVQELEAQGHTCIRLIEIIPMQISWCENELCLDTQPFPWARRVRFPTPEPQTNGASTYLERIKAKRGGIVNKVPVEPEPPSNQASSYLVRVKVKRGANNEFFLPT